MLPPEAEAQDLPPRRASTLAASEAMPLLVKKQLHVRALHNNQPWVTLDVCPSLSDTAILRRIQVLAINGLPPVQT